MERKRHLHVAESEADKEFADKLYERMNFLCGLVEEAFETDKVILLSPIMRQLVRDNARTLQKNLSKVMHRLHVDNLGDDLKWE